LTHHIDNGLEVESWVQQNSPDLVLLDIMLPGKDGIEICKGLRAFSSVPIIMLTARVEEVDRLLGLELGADDYVCKPFSPREVVARAKSVLRRSNPADTQELNSNISLDESRYKASINGRELVLTAVEFQLLNILYCGKGRIYSREQLIDSIYSDNRVVSDRTVDSHIKKLRKRIAEVIPGQEIIHSVYGVGYKFEEEG
jgi:two-component system response regulator BaeR